MTINDFIFSNQPRHRLARHLVFWILYCTFFFLQSIAVREYQEFFTAKPYFTALMNLCVYAPFFIGATYFFIYYLMKKKYFLFVLGFIAVYGIGTAINYFPSELFLRMTGWFPDTFEHRIEMSNFNTRWGMIIAFVAIGIKFSKSWYLQQKENLEILKRKTRIEMQLEKANIHPELLLRTLDTIHNDTQSGYSNAPSQILYLAELLSYSLYENDNEMVPLQKEFMHLKHLIMLENQNKDRSVDIRMNIKGDTNNKFIAPMVLVKMLEQGITHLHNSAIFSWIAEWHFVVTDTLHSTLSFSDSDENAFKNTDWTLLIEKARNRLKGYYNSKDFYVELVNNNNEIIIRLELKLLTETESHSFGANTNLKEFVYDAS